MNRGAVGASGESLVAGWYSARGWDVVARNWALVGVGELDVVAVRGGLVAVCEVKARSTAAFGSPASAVGPAKQRRLRRTAMAWLAGPGSSLRWSELRFDVAAVVGDHVEVIEGAF